MEVIETAAPAACESVCFFQIFSRKNAFFCQIHTIIYMRPNQKGARMLTEAELQKQWENLTFTDDFIFSRVMHSKNLTQNTTTRSARRAASQLP